MERDKLTIRELAPYLPYGLKIQTIGIYQDDPIFTMCDKRGLSNVSISDVLDFQGDYKPLVIPLSSLTKEIEVNGERFVPVEKLEELMPNTSNFNWLRSDCSHKDLRDTIIEYCVIDKLCEWHLDCFNLIERGLAIDKSTINP